jgi:proteasome assembly chaperone (PAC2) family protein
MNDSVDLWEIPAAEEIYLIAGWRQWADAGSISSGLPQYIIEQTGARPIGEIKPHGFYLFQIPGTHHFLRPEIKLEEGYRKSLKKPKNEFFYTGDDKKGLLIFLGDEPHLNVEGYAEAFFEAIGQLGVKRVVVVGGVYGAMPYDKDREISCLFSLPTLKAELDEYALRFSNYEGGATIGSYLVDQAELREIELLVFYAFVPAYDFSEESTSFQGVMVENDYKAWYDLLRRFNYMFKLNFDLTDLEQRQDDLLVSIAEKIKDLADRAPQLKIKEFLAKVSEDFTEQPFMPLDDVWDQLLNSGILDGLDGEEER